jgi:hypothetical protein
MSEALEEQRNFVVVLWLMGWAFTFMDGKLSLFMSVCAIGFFAYAFAETYWLLRHYFVANKTCKNENDCHELAIYGQSSIHLVLAISYGICRLFALTSVLHYIEPVYLNLVPAYFSVDLFLMYYPIQSSLDQRIIFTIHHLYALVIVAFYRVAPSCEDLSTVMLLSEIPILVLNFQHWQRLTGKKWPWYRFFTSLVALVLFYYFRIYQYSHTFHEIELVKDESKCILNRYRSMWTLLIVMQYVFFSFVVKSFGKSLLFVIKSKKK